VLVMVRSIARYAGILTYAIRRETEPPPCLRSQFPAFGLSP
jgi:hypothetical protein